MISIVLTCDDRPTERRQLTFPADCLIEVVVREAAMTFDMRPGNGGRLVLLDILGNPLNPDLTLEGEGVINNELLEIALVWRT